MFWNMLVGRRSPITLRKELSMTLSWSFYAVACICYLHCGNQFFLYKAKSIPIACYIVCSIILTSALFIQLSVLFHALLHFLYLSFQTLPQWAPWTSTAACRLFPLCYLRLPLSKQNPTFFSFLWRDFQCELWQRQLQTREKLWRVWNSTVRTGSVLWKCHCSWPVRT